MSGGGGGGGGGGPNGYGTLPAPRALGDHPLPGSGAALRGSLSTTTTQTLSLDRLADTLHVKVSSITGAFAAMPVGPLRGAPQTLPPPAERRGTNLSGAPARQRRSRAHANASLNGTGAPAARDSGRGAGRRVDSPSPSPPGGSVTGGSAGARPTTTGSNASPTHVPTSTTTPANQMLGTAAVDSLTSSECTSVLTIGGEGWDDHARDVGDILSTGGESLMCGSQHAAAAAGVDMLHAAVAGDNSAYAGVIAKWQQVRIPPLPIAHVRPRVDTQNAGNPVPPPYLPPTPPPPRASSGEALPPGTADAGMKTRASPTSAGQRQRAAVESTPLKAPAPMTQSISPPRIHSAVLSDSDFSSISSGPSILFPAAGDGLGWIEIPDVGSDSDSDWLNIPRGDVSPAAPLLDRDAKLPDVAGAFLDRLDYWMANHAPQLPTRAHMHIVHDDTGMAYGSVVPAAATEPRAAGGRRASARARRPLKKVLRLPRLPCEIQSLKVYKDGQRIFLSVELARPWLAWAVLALSFALETVLTYEMLHSMDTHAGTGGGATLYDTPLSVFNLWVSVGLFIFALAALLCGWILGEFEDPRIGHFLLSRYGVLLCLLIIAAYGGFTYSMYHADKALSSNVLMWSAPFFFLACAKVVRTRSITFRLFLGVVYVAVALALGVYIGMARDVTVQGWLRAVLGALGLSIYVYCAKQARPHLPLSVLVLFTSLGALCAQIPYAVADAENVQHALFGFAVAGAPVLQFCGYAATACFSISGWVWSLMYLSPLTIAGPLAAHRALAYAINDFATPPTPHLAILAILLVFLLLGTLVTCSIDLADTERKVKLTDPDVEEPRDVRGRGSGSPAESKMSMSLQGSSDGADEEY